MLAFPLMAQAASSCFTPPEARAAHFRTMQQEFNVAALNCRSVNPDDPSIASRYNVFVARFDSSLQANAQALRSHFKRAGGNLDIWMTKVANDAGQRVITDPEFCQRASDVLDKALTLEPAGAEDLATSTASGRYNVAECSEAVATPPKAKHGKTKHKSTAKKAQSASAQ